MPEIFSLFHLLRLAISYSNLLLLNERKLIFYCLLIKVSSSLELHESLVLGTLAHCIYLFNYCISWMSLNAINISLHCISWMSLKSNVSIDLGCLSIDHWVYLIIFLDLKFEFISVL
jgi:hypothetical protein